MNSKGINSTGKTAVRTESTEPLRILITALGGEGGGTLMNWIVSAARDSGMQVQATSVPGVAQRTGSTSYYIEVSRTEASSVFNLVPMPGRVDIVLSSELVEAARVLEAGYVSPDRTLLISSHSRVYATAEKIKLGDGRYDTESIESTAFALSRHCHLVDLQQLAVDNDTFISATLYGALAGSGSLPWSTSVSRAVIENGTGAEASLRGFDAAVAAINKDTFNTGDDANSLTTEDASTSDSLQPLIDIATNRLTEYQDTEYATLYRERMALLQLAATDEHEPVLEEAARRLANWMSYEDIARVADLKTRRQRFSEIREQCGASDEQLIRITEYLKPRAEEIADMLPLSIGKRIMRRVSAGKSFPFLGSGRRIPSNAAWGYWLLRAAASMKRWRRNSLRYQTEQHAIELWLTALTTAIANNMEYAVVLAELPRLRKGYSDTLQRGLQSYDAIFELIIKPAQAKEFKTANSHDLRKAIDAALADDNHKALNESVMKFVPKQSLALSTDTVGTS